MSDKIELVNIMEKPIKIPLRNKNRDIVAYTIVDQDIFEIINLKPKLKKKINVII